MCIPVHEHQLTTFLVVTLKTQVLTVTAYAQNTLQHFKREKCPPCPCLWVPMFLCHNSYKTVYVLFIPIVNSIYRLYCIVSMDVQSLMYLSIQPMFLFTVLRFYTCTKQLCKRMKNAVSSFSRANTFH